jgi:hypothetical protein
MSWLDLFFLAFFLNLGLTFVVMQLHRLERGVSPAWEGGVLVAITLWLITVAIRVGADVLGLSFAGGAAAVQTFFWGGVAATSLLWGMGQIREAYLYWGLEEKGTKPKTP